MYVFLFFFNYFAFVLACVVVVVLYIRVFSSQWCKLEKQNRHNVCIFADFLYVQPRFTIESVFTRGFHH